MRSIISKRFSKKLLTGNNLIIKRTVPPAAAPIYLIDALNGLRGSIRGAKEVERLCLEIKSYFGVQFCFTVSSGKAALYLILEALKRLHPDRNEVIIPAFCCYSVPSAITRAGLQLRLCDVDPDTLDYDYKKLKALLQKYEIEKTPSQKINQGDVNREKTNQIGINKTNRRRLLAVISVHLFGATAAPSRVRRLVKDQEVTIIEDAAQVMGFESKEKYLGTIGDVGLFSLGRGKSISTVEGGVILTNNIDVGKQLYQEIDKISEYPRLLKLKLILLAVALIIFQRPSLFWFPKMIPFLRIGDTIYDPKFKIYNLTSFQAGIARRWKTKLASFTESRIISSQEWSKLKSLRLLCEKISNNGNVINFIRYPMKLKNNLLWHHLLQLSESKGLGIMHTYPDSIKEIKELKNKFEGQDYPFAQQLCQQLLTLPVHPLLNEKDKIKIRSCLINTANTFKNL